jgi:tetratricopeptide (TPR) repeat protein
MADLHDLLQKSDRVAIAAVGMGGVGKTTLARRYAKAYQADYPGGIWWVSAARLVTDVLGYVDRLGWREELRTDLTEGQIVQHYWGLWQERFGESKLLVLDDVEEYGAVREFLPQQGSFQVLITTRVRFGPPVKRLDLGVLKRSAALRLFRMLMADDDRLGLEMAAARELCEWLGYLPLGIELVGRYLADGGSIAAVLAELKQKSLDARPIDTVPDEMDYRWNVDAAIGLSWDKLEAPVQRVGMLLGVFALAPIELEWVEDCLPEMDDVEALLDRALVKRSLLGRGQQGYQLHSLVREFVRGKLVGDELAQRFTGVMTEIAKTIDQTGRIAKWEKVQSALPHLAEATKSVMLLEVEDDRTWSFIGLAWFYEGQSLWQEAEAWCVACRDFSVSHFGERHPMTATSLNNLAGLYELMGHYEAAEPLHLEALEIRRTQLGGSHPKIGESLHNLALLYRSMGCYEVAEPLYLEALEIHKTQLGERHPRTGISLNSLAGLYRLMGRYEAAELLYLEALEIRKMQLGERHPSTGTSLNDLALLYVSMGRYEAAEPLHLEALEISKTQLGDRHLTTGRSLHNLGLLYAFMGRYQAAEPLHLEALEIYKMQLGDRHPETGQNLHNLAELYRLMGRYSAAEPLHLEALEIRKMQLGDRHPDTAESLNDLAGLYESMGRYSAAEPLYLEALEIRKAQLGDRHPSTGTSLNDLAGLYRAMGRYSAAAPLYLEALEIKKAQLGDRHPDTATSLNNLAVFYCYTKQFDRALPLLEEAFTIYQEVLPSKHPYILGTQQSLVNLREAIEQQNGAS